LIFKDFRARKDLDFDRHQIIVRQGKGQKDRVTMLPAATITSVVVQLGLRSIRVEFEA
jgi:integrase